MSFRVHAGSIAPPSSRIRFHLIHKPSCPITFARPDPLCETGRNFLNSTEKTPGFLINDAALIIIEVRAL